MLCFGLERIKKRIKVNEPDLEIFTLNVAKANAFCHLQLRQLKQTAIKIVKRKFGVSHYRSLCRLCENVVLTNPSIYARDMMLTEDSGFSP